MTKKIQIYLAYNLKCYQSYTKYLTLNCNKWMFSKRVSRFGEIISMAIHYDENKNILHSKRWEVLLDLTGRVM